VPTLLDQWGPMNDERWEKQKVDREVRRRQRGIEGMVDEVNFGEVDSLEVRRHVRKNNFVYSLVDMNALACIVGHVAMMLDQKVLWDLKEADR
jgi:hypothetical protein